MYLVVGLGNPGKEYTNTRHNAGWMLTDALAKELGAGEWRTEKSFESQLAEYRSEDGTRCYLAKPITFMNNSGRAVVLLARFYKIPAENILVMHDELDLPLGTLRTRLGGSAAGHHGVESIAYHLGTEAFWRLRFGIAPTSIDRPAQASGFVLGQFTADEKAITAKAVDLGVQLVKDSLSSGILREETITIA